MNTPYTPETLFGIENQVAFVTGAAAGIGKTIAHGLAGLGATVVLADINAEQTELVAAAIRAAGHAAMAVQTDITNEASIESAAARAVETYGRIDTLVNVAGVLYNERALDFDMDKWQWVMDVNVKGTFLASRAVARRMVGNGGGRIINFSSVRSVQAKEEYHAYAPSKGAINQLTRSLAIEWAPDNINVNAIAPTFTLTELNRSLLEDDEIHDWVMRRIPKGELLQMEWLIGPVAFLACEASRFITGQILFVDGGWTAA